MTQGPQQFPSTTWAQLREIFQDINFPAEKAVLLMHARKQSASNDIIDAMVSLPNRTFQSGEEVIRYLDRLP